MDWFDSAMRRTTVNKETGCWEFNGELTPNGYGRVKLDGKRVRLHRVSFSRLVGRIQEGIFVCHHCDVRNCWNPDHLFLGTHRDNVRDMWSKGRGRTSIKCGSGNPLAKLTEDKVRSIRSIPNPQEVTLREIGSMFGVSPETIRKVLKGDLWQHVK